MLPNVFYRSSVTSDRAWHQQSPRVSVSEYDGARLGRWVRQPSSCCVIKMLCHFMHLRTKNPPSESIIFVCGVAFGSRLSGRVCLGSWYVSTFQVLCTNVRGKSHMSSFYSSSSMYVKTSKLGQTWRPCLFYWCITVYKRTPVFICCSVTGVFQPVCVSGTRITLMYLHTNM